MKIKILKKKLKNSYKYMHKINSIRIKNTKIYLNLMNFHKKLYYIKKNSMTKNNFSNYYYIIYMYFGKNHYLL
jgi:hypothetical protein